MKVRNSGNSPLRVRMLPDWREANPYQQLLADGIESNGTEVSFCSDYYRGLPVFRDFLKNRGSVDVYHLHWLSNYIRFEEFPKKHIYGVKLLFDLFLVKLAGIRLVWTIHNLLPHETKYPGFEKWINRRVASLADELIVHSVSAQDAVVENYGIKRERIKVIPHGHYRSVYGELPGKSVAKKKLHLDESKKVILCLGMLRPYKGIEDLIEAWRLLPGELKAGAILLIAGKAIDSDYLGNIEVLRADESSIRLDEGFIPDSELLNYIASADAVALPFRRILTSGSLLLAISYGRPVISPNIPLVKEVIGEAPGFIYDGGIDSLARAIENAVNSDCEKLTAAIESRAEQFGWTGIGKATSDLYGRQTL